MAITNAQQAKQLQQEGGPMRKIKGQDHMLAYITPNEADKLVKLGGQETMTPEGILAYPEFDNYTEVGGGTKSQFEGGGGYEGVGSSNDGVIQQYNTPKEKPPVIPKKKPKKTKDNYKKSSQFTTPTLAAFNFLGNQLKNSKFGQYLNTKAREDYLENLKEDDPDLYQATVDDLAKLGYATRDVEIYGPKGKRDGPMAPGRDIETFTDLYEDQAKSILNTVTDSPDGGVGTLYDDYLDEKMNRFTPDNDGGNQVMDPCKGPNPPAYCFVGNDTEEDVTPTRNLGGLAPRFAGSIFDFTGLADGGRAGMMDGGMMEDTPEGGIMDLESGRQMYFLGKLVKKATRAVKKVAKSPIGKAALLYFGGGALGNLAGGSGLGGMFKGAMTPGQFFTKNKLANVFTKGGAKNILFGGQKLMGNAAKNNFVDFSGILGSGGKFSLGKTLGLSLGLPFALDALGVGKDEDKGFDIDEYYKSQGIDIADIRNNPYNFLAPRFAADGGLMRTGYQEGGDAEPVAKKTMPLLDMNGMEKDYREEGGFVPIGRMERADDVPARLSKNEFVFTADAVRNAGEGDIDKGAEVMYNMMKNLESGGEVSEESQGLDGAREMFKTSQRLEEVL